MAARRPFFPAQQFRVDQETITHQSSPRFFAFLRPPYACTRLSGRPALGSCGAIEVSGSGRAKVYIPSPPYSLESLSGDGVRPGSPTSVQYRYTAVCMVSSAGGRWPSSARRGPAHLLSGLACCVDQDGEHEWEHQEDEEYELLLGRKGRKNHRGVG
jgi:hypothetical protein